MANTILEIADLTIGYSHSELCKEINSSVQSGELLLLAGANGMGKSTLLKTLCGIEKPLNGCIKLNEKELKDYSDHDLAKQIAFIPSTISLMNGILVKELISFARIPYKQWFQKTNKTDWQLIHQIAEQLLISDLLEKRFDKLSDGQKQKVNIARCLVQETPVILLDEPTAHLDIINKRMVFSLLKELSKQGKTIICTTHDIHDAAAFASGFWLIDKNGVFHESSVESKPVDDLISQMF